MENVCSLMELKSDEIGVLYRIENLEKAKHKRLIEMGFVSDAKLEVLRKNKNIVLVGVRGFTLCLDKRLAEAIKVYRGKR